MPTTLIDDFGSLAPWQALTPANTPSLDIAIALDAPGPALPAGGKSLRADIAATATGHRIERVIPATNLNTFSELRFWIRGSQPTSEASAAPFRLEFRLGSAALPINAPGNDWHRRLPIAPAARWSLVRLALDDLPPAVRGAATRIALFVLPGDGAVSIWLDDLRAAAPQMVADADVALVGAIDGGLLIGGTPVPAVIDVPGMVLPATPYTRIVNYSATPADMLGGQPQRHGDYTVTGHRIYPEAEAWHLHYRIEFASDDADAQSAMLDFTLARLGIRATLDIGGLAHRIERIRETERRDKQAVGPLLRYRLTTSLERGNAIQVRPVGEMRLSTELNEEAA
ncbi:MAG: hypothetical protein V4564_05895 [Pseudomonadota bacterium]